MSKKVKMNGSTDYSARRELASGLKGMKFLGVIVTWNSGPDGSTHKQSEVQSALTTAGLDPKIARDLLPRNAFQRATKKLSKERVIDLFGETQSELVFQFTRKHLDSLQWEFKKESFVTLNKNTGVVMADDATLATAAQTAVDAAMELRTTSDITRIVQRVFEQHADLIPIRDAGGVYFVPDIHTGFISKVELFLKTLGGDITQIPVPAGTATGDRSIQNAVAANMESLIRDHMEAVSKFEPNTRKDTIGRVAEEIKTTRIRIEAYASYLKDKQDELIAKVGEANDLLKEQVERIGGGTEAYSEYDWDVILDGKVHEMIKGVDYLGSVGTALALARTKGKKVGLRIQSRILDDGNRLIIRAIPAAVVSV